MGIELVKVLAARHAARLSQRALVVALHMALHALDAPNSKGQPARLYFAGWEPLALAMGYEVPSSAAMEKVRRAIKELREAGLIEPIAGHAQAGNRQSYRLHLALAGAADSPTEPEGLSPTDSEGQVPHRSRGNSPTDSEGPKTELGPTKDSSQDHNRIASATQPQTAPANPNAVHVDWSRLHEFRPEDASDPYCRCGRPEKHDRHFPRSA